MQAITEQRSDWRFQPLWGLIFLIIVSYIGFVPAQSNFIGIFVPYTFLFLLGTYAYWTCIDRQSLRFWLTIAFLARFMLVFSFPNLSDDIYRFIWDGYLINAGYNPFDQLPGYYLDNAFNIPGIDQALFEQLNSPAYFTIYPPIAQFTFATATFLFPQSWWGSAVVMKLFLFVFELGNLVLIMRLLSQNNKPVRQVLLYALNPLIIIEIMGNLHFEGAMIFFLLLSLWFLARQHWHYSAVAFAFSIASKLLPLMFLPFLIQRLGWKTSVKYFALLGATLLLLFAPLLSGVFFSNFGESLNLYFRRFEFNASLYNVLKWVGYQQYGYNLIKYIGPMLALTTFVGIILSALLERGKKWEELFGLFLFAITLYLINTPTVHPWYLCLPLVLCLFTDYRFPIIWSALIVFTYVNYSYPDYHENKWVIWVEYMTVLTVLGFEWKRYYYDNWRSTAPQLPPL